MQRLCPSEELPGRSSRRDRGMPRARIAGLCEISGWLRRLNTPPGSLDATRLNGLEPHARIATLIGTNRSVIDRFSSPWKEKTIGEPGAGRKLGIRADSRRVRCNRVPRGCQPGGLFGYDAKHPLPSPLPEPLQRGLP